MAPKYLTILFFLLHNSCYAQEPGEYATLQFLDTNQLYIYPDLTITGLNISYSKNMEIEAATLHFDSTSVEWGRGSSLYIRSLGGRHCLDEEIKIVAKYKNRSMSIIIFGHKIIPVWGIWEHKPLKINFKEGNFLYFVKRFIDTSSTNSETKIKDTILQILVNSNFSIFKPSEKIRKLNFKTNKYFITDTWQQSSTLLDKFILDRKSYYGYVFKNGIPYGYTRIDTEKKINQVVIFGKSFENVIKKYYR